MEQIIRAGNTIYKHSMTEDDLAPYQLRTDGYEKFAKYFSEIDGEHGFFRTPINLQTPTSGPGYQYVPNERRIETIFTDYVCSIVNEHLNTTLVLEDIWYLHQTQDSWVNNPAHCHLTAEWVVVLFLDVKSGDTIQFFDSSNNMEEYSPTFGDFILFKGDIQHKPGPNSSSKRLTLNAELGRSEKPEEEGVTSQTRFSICKECDRYNTETGICSENNEYMPMKISYMDMTCPLDKW